MRHHGPFEGIYPTVLKWLLREKLPHIDRGVYILIVPKGWPVVGHNVLASALGPTARTNPGTLPGPRQWDIVNTRQEAREPPRALLSGGDAVLVPHSNATRHPARAHQQCLYQVLPCCHHQNESPSEWAVGMISTQAAPACFVPPIQLQLAPSP